MKASLRILSILTIAMLSLSYAYGQYTQTIKGTVVDRYTGTPLIGANIVLADTNRLVGTVTDIDGYFYLENVPVGRQSLQVSYLGYHPAFLENLYVQSGKELVLEIELEEKVTQLEGVVVTAHVKDKSLNEMAQVSARMFTIEETERYAGSFGDPSRMAASYAGILTLGTQSNDIVIRGNSPAGMLWRMEGLQIPNPNHFGDAGSTGGTVSMLNNNVLSNSDFFTGAFPAEFGNALSGVFDLNLRSGNRDKREYMAQIGFNGFELGLEGPLPGGNGGAYIANYRYSTIGVFDLLGINFGVFAVPKYQDLSFRIDLPASKAGQFALFGIGGINSITDESSEGTPGASEFFDNRSSTGFAGLSHEYKFNDHSGITTRLGLSGARNSSRSEQKMEGALEEFNTLEQQQTTMEINLEYKNRINSRNILKVGVDMLQSDFTIGDSIYLPDYNLFTQTIDANGQTVLLQSFAQWKHRFSDQFSVVGGLHYQYAQTGNDHSVEPRLSLNWNFLPQQSLSLGAGIHSQMQPRYVYFYEELADTLNQIYRRPNENLKMTRSHHLVLGYQYSFNNDHRLKIEGYYQYLNRVPVEAQASYLSLLNYGTSFSAYEYEGLVNEGTGYNIGAEITLEKFFSNHFYYLLTLSVFDSKYRGSDGVWRNTRFNTKAIGNLLGGYEWTIGSRDALTLDGRVMWSGGERKLPLDYEASAQAGTAVYDIDRAYEERFPNYFRLDLRVSYKLNRKTSHTFAVDIMNVTNRPNHYLALYDADLNDYSEVSTLGLLPTVLWRWNF